MARFSRLQVWNKMEEVGLVPLFYHADVETAKKIDRGGLGRRRQGDRVHQPRRPRL